MSRRAAAASLLLSGVLSGCATDRVEGVPPVMPGAGRPQSGAVAGACSFHIEAIDDQREVEGLGATGITRIGGEHFRSWFKEGIYATPGHVASPAPLTVRITVTKAYFHTLYSLKAANIIVRVTSTGTAMAPVQKTYRGVDASTQWSTSEREVQSAFEGALADLRRQLAADFSAPCKA